MTIQFNNLPPAGVSGPARPFTETDFAASLASPRSPATVQFPQTLGVDPQDDLALALPAGQRRGTTWDPTSELLKVANGPELKTRLDISIYLKAKGIPEAEVDTTMAWLDKQGADYAEIGGLIDKQLSFDRDVNDVLGAVQAYGVLLEGRNLHVPGTDSAHYNEVMAGLRDGRVRIDKDTGTDMSDVAGRYRFQDDTVYLTSDFKVGSVYERSVLFHELIHTGQDVSHEHDRTANKPEFKEAEVEAYKAQGAFLVKSGYKPEQGELKGHKILNPALRYAQWQAYEKQLLTKNPPDMAKVLKAREQMEKLEEDIGYHVWHAYDSADKPLTADGLHTHHH